MRWAQLTLVEDDPGQFDPGFWLDYFRRTHSDAVCLSAGGCVAYYPTTVRFHHRSAWLGERDPFGDLVAGCRKLGMAVIARTDPHATYDDVEHAHPDWIAVDSAGQKRRHWASPEMWVTCALGPYNFEFMREVHREIMTRYRVDGIFINRWEGSGMCFCEHCKSNFKAASGFDLPTTNDPQNPARRAYILWRQQRLFDLWRLWDSDVRADQSRLVRDSQHGRRLDQHARHEDDRRARSHSVRRPPGTQRRDGPLGQRQERQGIPLDHGPEADRRHLQRGRGGSLPLERLGPEPRRDPPLGHRRHRQRPASLVHQVRRHDPRPALAEGCRRPLPLAPSR